MLFYRAALPLSRQTLTYVAGVIRRHRRQIGSCWRKLNPGQQALLVLAYLRKGETFAELAAGFGVGTATAWRYVNETVALLAARAPKLRQALRDAKKAGHAYVVMDGTLIPIDRVAADRPFYSGKHHRHGMNLQVIASPGRRHRVGVRAAARRGARPDRRPDLGRRCASWPPPAWSCWPTRATRAPATHVRHPVPGQEQAGIAEGTPTAPTPSSAPRRARERPAQDLAHPAQAPLLPLARRAARQGHPRPAGPRDRRMKKAQYSPLRRVAE